MGQRVKVLFIISFLLSSVSVAHGQSAGEIDTLSQWRVDHTVGEPQYMYYSHYKYYISGTITIDSVEYYQIYISGYSQVNNWPPNYFSGYYAPLREENDKWYTIDDNENDVLLYDFTLNIGDTIDSYANYYGAPGILTVTSIDTIFIDGELKKKFNLSDNFGAEYIIEDLGANTGLFEPLIWFEDYSILHCFAKDYIPLWLNPESGSCDLTVGINERELFSNTHVYPNPFITSTTLEFELYSRSKIQLTIYNSIGVLVYQQEDEYDQGHHSVTVSLSHCPSGLYYGVLSSDEGVSVVKIVKQ